MIIPFGYTILFKKKRARWGGLDLYTFYRVYFFGIPLFFQKGAGLFDPQNKRDYYELGKNLEKKILKIKTARELEYIIELEKYHQKKQREIKDYLKNKEKIEKEDTKEFVDFLKIAGGAIMILLLIGIIKFILS